MQRTRRKRTITISGASRFTRRDIVRIRKKNDDSNNIVYHRRRTLRSRAGCRVLWTPVSPRGDTHTYYTYLFMLCTTYAIVAGLVIHVIIIATRSGRIKKRLVDTGTLSNEFVRVVYRGIFNVAKCEQLTTVAVKRIV